MIVPSPGRGDDEVAGLHPGSLTLHGRVCARTLDDKAQRDGCMTVSRCDLTRRYELQARVERIGNEMLALETGILEYEHAPFGFFGTDDIC